jgi:hypothetical protein
MVLAIIAVVALAGITAIFHGDKALAISEQNNTKKLSNTSDDGQRVATYNFKHFDFLQLHFAPSSADGVPTEAGSNGIALGTST